MITKDVQLNVNAYILILPYLIILMAVMGLGLGIIFSALTTKYRDLSFLLQFGIQLLMYATPVIYPLETAKGKLRAILELNPLTSIVECFRSLILGQGVYDFGGILYSSIFAIKARKPVPYLFPRIFLPPNPQILILINVLKMETLIQTFGKMAFFGSLRKPAANGNYLSI